MHYLYGARMSARQLGNRDSLAGRGFFEVLWRWSRVSCQASRPRKCGAKVLHTGSRTQHTSLPRVKPRLKPLFLSRSWQRCLNSSVPLSTTIQPQSLRTEEIKSCDGRLRESYSSSIPLTDALDAQNPTTAQAVVEEELQSPISHQLRRIMRTLPSSVVVLTATSAPLKSKPDPNVSHSLPPRLIPTSSRGMTLSSFASLALSPEPVITFNVRCPSSTIDAICRSKRFLIHVLDANSEGACIANAFTKGNGRVENPAPGYVFEKGVKDGLFAMEEQLVMVQNAGVENHIVLPRLSGKGIGKVLSCELLEGLEPGQSGKVKIDFNGLRMTPKGLIVVGDHVLVLARVVAVLDRAGYDSQGETNYGLSYVDGRYRLVGDAILPLSRKEL